MQCREPKKSPKCSNFKEDDRAFALLEVITLWSQPAVYTWARYSTTDCQYGELITASRLYLSQVQQIRLPVGWVDHSKPFIPEPGTADLTASRVSWSHPCIPEPDTADLTASRVRYFNLNYCIIINGRNTI